MIEQQVGRFKRKIVFMPAFSWRSDTPSRDYGIGAMRMWFVLIGDKGAVQWQIGTDWHIEKARAALNGKPPIWDPYKPTGYDLGYHAPEPQFDGQNSAPCDILSGGTCYFDCSYVAADRLIEGFLNGGDDWVWNRLEAYYEHQFEGKDYPNFDPIIVPHPDERPQLS